MINRAPSKYKENKVAKVGETIKCPVCGDVFIKKQYSQAFCCSACKDYYWNRVKKDRHKNPDYHHNYNMKHPERLERVGIYKENGEFGYYDDEGNFNSFREDFECWAMCDNPQLGI